MPDVKPFKAIIYNQEKIKDLSKVACPPYDVITPERQLYYHSLSPYNFIHLILGKDIAGEDKYSRAGSSFNSWLKDGVLVPDKSPAFYFYSQQYTIQGEKKVRLGFIGLLHLGDKKSSAFGHEHTRLKPLEDRLKLIRQVKANLSPVFVIFDDRQRIIQSTYKQYILGRDPFIDISDSEGVRHKLWRMDAPELLSKIREKMQDDNFFIADGHHRFEVACNYREEIRKKDGTVAAESDVNYILTYFTNTESKGLSIMPIHRLVKLGVYLNWQDFLLKLKDYFDLNEVAERSRFLFLMRKAGFAERVIGMYKDKKYWILRLKNIRILDKIMADRPVALRTLDVSVLNQIVFKKILGFQLDDHDSIAYVHDSDELIKRADNDKTQVAFLLNPVKVDQITAVAITGERMPPKSTFFYPKVLSGLVVNKHE